MAKLLPSTTISCNTIRIITKDRDRPNLDFETVSLAYSLIFIFDVFKKILLEIFSVFYNFAINYEGN